MSKEDLKCESLISANRASFDVIRREVSKNDLEAWTDLLKGVRPIQAKRESLESWLSLYREKIPKITELDKQIQLLIMKANVSRAFVICSLRQLQKEYGLSTNFNAFKDSAVRKLLQLKK